jgi:hypothetical protein
MSISLKIYKTVFFLIDIHLISQEKEKELPVLFYSSARIDVIPQ